MTKLEKFAQWLIEKRIISGDDREIIIFGLVLSMQLLLSAVTTIVIGIILGVLLETIVFIVSYAFIRTYAGGFHCKTPTRCYFLSSGIVVLVILIYKFSLKYNIFIMSLIILSISIIILLKYSPMETANRPLDNKEMEYFKKRLYYNLIIEACIYVNLLYLKLYKYCYIISLGIAVSALLVLIQKVIVSKKQYKS